MIDLRDCGLDAEAVRKALELAPHPEGGAYREIWRDAPQDGGRGAATSILFLLAAGERSHWHRVDAAELWLWQAGAPLRLQVCEAPNPPKTVHLGPGLGAGEVPQGIVPSGAWQAAESLGAWTLVSCVVAPAFTFSGFELAPPGWSPGG
jgi:predicted cupin superfamily sugar epimerase